MTRASTWRGSEECRFWAPHAGAELDLLVVRGNAHLRFEIKRTTAPSVNRSMRMALGDSMRAFAVAKTLQDIEPLG